MDAETRRTINANRALANKNKVTVNTKTPEQLEDEEWQSTLPMQRRGIAGTGWRTGPEGKAHKEAWKKKKMSPPPAIKEPALTDIAKP